MSAMMEGDIKRWTAKRKAVLLLEIIEGNTTMAEASSAFDYPTPLSELVQWAEESKRGMENTLRSNPLGLML